MIDLLYSTLRPPPLGEIAALRRSKGIANIVVGHPMPIASARVLRLSSPIVYCALSSQTLRRIVGGKQGQAPALAQAPVAGWRSQLWAEISNEKGISKTFYMETGEGYLASAQAALANIEALASSERRGSFTPGLAFGTSLLERLPDVRIQQLIQCNDDNRRGREECPYF